MGRQENVEIFENTQRLYSSNERLISAIKNFDGAEIRKAAEAMKSKAEDIARGKRDYMTYEEVFGE